MPGRSHGWRSPRRRSGAGPARRGEFDAVTTLSICDGRSGRDSAVAGRADLFITCELRKCRELSFYRTRQVRQCYKRRSQPERTAGRSTTPRAMVALWRPGQWACGLTRLKNRTTVNREELLYVGENSSTCCGRTWPCHLDQRIRPGDIEDRADPALLGAVRRRRKPARRRHQALHPAAWRRGRRKEDRDHPQGHRRPGPRRRQASGAGAGRQGPGRYPGRLRLDAGGARRCRHRHGGEENDGRDERSNIDHHREVTLYRPDVADDSAGQLRLRQMGFREGWG